MDRSHVALATACLPERTLTEAIDTARALGFQALGMTGGTGSRHSGGLLPGFYWDELDSDERATLVEQVATFKRGAIHAPFHDLPLISVNPYVEREAARQTLVAIEAAGALGLEVVTVHAVPAGRLPETEFWSRLVRTIRALGDAAEEAGTRIGIENVRFPSSPDEHVELLERVDHPRVGATLDLGHIAFWFNHDGVSGLPIPEAADLYNSRLLTQINRLGDRIFNVHTHDVRAADLRDHRGVGRGIIRFDAVIERLEGLGYDGLLELELEEADAEEAAVESLECLDAIVRRRRPEAGR